MTERDRYFDRLREPEVDVVIVGLGWAGGIIAAELTKAGFEVVGLERGPDRNVNDPEFKDKHDELAFKVRNGLMQDVSTETWTFRHDVREPALPIRELGAFRPGTGVGGSSVHYGGQVVRYAPWTFEMHSQVISRYGASAFPEESSVQDWGVNYEEMAPFYDTFEEMVGAAGRAGNLNGNIQDGGNPFEGPRCKPFPLPPPKDTASAALFRDASQSLGHHPFPTAVAVLPQNYTNPDGITRPACMYCGDCAFHVCAVEAKGDARTTVIAAARRTGRLEVRPMCNVFRVLHDGCRASGVLYHDQSGRVVEQPAAVVVLTAYTLNNVRLLLMSKMGRPYEPMIQEGVVGKNYAYHSTVTSVGFFKGRRFKRYMGAGASGYAIDDFNCDNFDHSEVDFIGGAHIQCAPAPAGPITGLLTPEGTPEWGSAWKSAIREWYDSSIGLFVLPEVLGYKDNFLDLDPTYRDAWGQPLLRITFDWHENERRIIAFAAGKVRRILSEMRPSEILVRDSLPSRFDVRGYQSTHNTGGAIMGSDPSSSVVNPSLQMWEFNNVWVVGGSAFPQISSHGPTGTICALAYRAADAIVSLCRNRSASIGSSQADRGGDP